MSMQKNGYTEEELQTRINEGVKEEQEFHEKLAETKTEKIKNDKNELTEFWILLGMLMKSTVHKASN